MIQENWLKAARDRHAIHVANTRSAMALGAGPAWLISWAKEQETILGVDASVALESFDPRYAAAVASATGGDRFADRRIAKAWLDARANGWRKECPTLRRNGPMGYRLKCDLTIGRKVGTSAKRYFTPCDLEGSAKPAAPRITVGPGLCYQAKRAAPSRWTRIGKRDLSMLTPKAYRSGSYHSRLDWIASLKANGVKGRIAKASGPTGCPFTGNRRERETQGAPVPLASAMVF